MTETTPLKQAVRDHVEKVELSEEQLASLEAMLSESPTSSDTSDVLVGARRMQWAFVASALACVVGSIVWSAKPGGDPPGAYDEIAREVARNHLKLKPLEVEASELAQARPFFATLDIRVPDASTVIDGQPWELQGGRHCSIQGEDAAQMRYTDRESGEVVSVYMAPYVPEVVGRIPDVGEGGAPVKVQANGVDVWIWVERGMLLAATP